jgi:hypothetical protein
VFRPSTCPTNVSYQAPFMYMQICKSAFSECPVGFSAGLTVVLTEIGHGLFPFLQSPVAVALQTSLYSFLRNRYLLSKHAHSCYHHIPRIQSCRDWQPRFVFRRSRVRCGYREISLNLFFASFLHRQMQSLRYFHVF